MSSRAPSIFHVRVNTVTLFWAGKFKLFSVVILGWQEMEVKVFFKRYEGD